MEECQYQLISKNGTSASASSTCRFFSEENKESDLVEVMDFWDLYNVLVDDVNQLLFGDHTETIMMAPDYTVDRLKVHQLINVKI